MDKVREHHPKANWHAGKRRQLDTTRPLDAVLDEFKSVKARIGACGEPIFGVVGRVLRYTKVRYKGRRKNTAQITTLWMLVNLGLMRRRLMQPPTG